MKVASVKKRVVICNFKRKIRIDPLFLLLQNHLKIPKLEQHPSPRTTVKLKLLTGFCNTHCPEETLIILPVPLRKLGWVLPGSDMLVLTKGKVSSTYP